MASLNTDLASAEAVATVRHLFEQSFGPDPSMRTVMYEISELDDEVVRAALAVAVMALPAEPLLWRGA